MGSNTEDGLCPYAARLIRIKARQLVGKYGFLEADREDIEQELAIRFLAQWTRYDSSIARPHTYISRIINSKVRSLIEHQLAAKRGNTIPHLSLDEEIELQDGSTCTRHEIVGIDDYLMRTGKTTRSSAELRDLRIDVETVIRRLPPRNQLVARLLQDMTVAEIARETDLPRSTVDYIRNRLRDEFKAAGIDEYL